MSLALISANLPLPTTADLITFVLVLTRIGAAFALAPMLSGRSVPARVKAVFAIFISIAIMSAVKVPAGLEAAPVGKIFIMMLVQALIGLAIGLAIGMVVAAWALAGAYLDISTGFSYGGVVDPQYGNQSSVLQSLYVMLAGIIFVLAGGEEILIGALAKSLTSMPLGMTLPTGDLANLALQIIQAVFVTGLGVVAPVLIALLLTDIAFGLVSRAAPQTQIIALEFPVKIAVAIVMLIATLPWMVPLLSRATGGMLQDLGLGV